MAVTALMNEDFESARPHLMALASQCQAGEHGRRAVLMLAASELDPGNGSGSPATAAELARGYLLLPDAPREEIVLARALYRVAADLGGLEETTAAAESTGAGLAIAPRFNACGEAPQLRFRNLPTTSDETLAARMQALEARLGAKSDSLAAARTSAEASSQRVAELEQELERITQLLTSGAERLGASDR